LQWDLVVCAKRSCTFLIAIFCSSLRGLSHHKKHVRVKIINSGALKHKHRPTANCDTYSKSGTNKRLTMLINLRPGASWHSLPSVQILTKFKIATNEQFICSFACCADTEETQSSALHQTIIRKHPPSFSKWGTDHFAGF